MITRIKFPKNLKKQVYQALQKSKRITSSYEIHNSILYISSEDVEETEKVFDRLVLNYKII